MKIDSHIFFLATCDLPKTADFYEKKLRLTLALDQGTCRIYRVAHEAYIGFCKKSEMPSTEGVIVTIVTKQVDEYYELLRTQGVAVEQAPIYNADFDIYHFFVRDPNGYLVEIQRFDDPRWHEIAS